MADNCSTPCNMPKPKLNPSRTHAWDVRGYFNGLRALQTTTTRQKVLYVCLRSLMQNIYLDEHYTHGTRYVAQPRHTAAENPCHTWAPKERQPRTYKLWISRYRFGTPCDRPCTPWGAIPVSLVVCLGRCGASRGPRAHLSVAATAAAADAFSPAAAAAAAAGHSGFALAFDPLAGSSSAEAPAVATPPSTYPPRVTPRRLVPAAAVWGRTTRLYTQSSPKRHCQSGSAACTLLPPPQRRPRWRGPRTVAACRRLFIRL